MPGLLRGVARTAVIAGTATSVSNRVSKRQAERWNQQEPRRRHRPNRRHPLPPPRPRPSRRSISSGSWGAEKPGDPHRGGVRRPEGQAARRLSGAGVAQPGGASSGM